MLVSLTNFQQKTSPIVGEILSRCPIPGIIEPGYHNIAVELDGEVLLIQEASNEADSLQPLKFVQSRKISREIEQPAQRQKQGIFLQELSRILE